MKAKVGLMEFSLSQERNCVCVDRGLDRALGAPFLPSPRTEPTHAPVHCQLAHIQVKIHEDLCLLLGLSHPMILYIASLLTFRSEYMKIFASSWG